MNVLIRALTVSLISLVSSGATATAEPIAVVVSDKVSVGSLTQAQLRQIFLGQPTRVGGKKVIPLNLPTDSTERQSFDQAVLGMSPQEVPRFWVDQRIRGKAKPPKTIPSSSTVARLVAKLPGAIGYVPASQVGPGVTVLAIDGKKPEDADYPLQN